MLYNETIDIISSSDKKPSDSCVVYIILSFVFLIIISKSMVICFCFFLYLNNRSTNSHHFGF